MTAPFFIKVFYSPPDPQVNCL